MYSADTPIAGPSRCARALSAAALFLLLLFACNASASAAGTYFKVDYPGSSVEGELQTPVTYTVWIPERVAKLRGVIVHQHGAGTTASIEGSTSPYDLHWQALAKKWDCALFGGSYHVKNEAVDLTPGGSEQWFDPRRGSDKTFLRALDDFAKQSNHPELSNVPWALWGHSGGGIWADVMCSLHPDRVAVMWLRSGSAHMFRPRPEFTPLDVNPKVYGVPAMCNPGFKEQFRGPWIGTMATFQEYRAKGAPIGFAPDPRTGHECGDSRYLAIPYFDACLALRLPDKGSENQTLKPIDIKSGWLAPLMSDTPKRFADFKGDPNVAVWLPNEAVGKAWAEYLKVGSVKDTTAPFAPTGVSTSPKGELGIEVTWSAEADFESGIAQFVILRDGKEIARVPEKPIGQFGRPLFQSMTYHDTPAQPVPEMRYVDANAKPGETHTYAVVTINSVGLRSDKPAEAAPAQANGGAKPAKPFDGKPTQWHEGFARYDFVMDEQTLAITPFKAAEGERHGIGAPEKGKRRCVVIAPKSPAPGNPWSWRGCYWDHQPQTEVELLRRGFHIAYISADATLRPDKTWEAWYAWLTGEHGLSPRPAFIGMSRGGEYAYTWATDHPGEVACIYADNPGTNKGVLSRLSLLADRDVPLLHVCGSIDPLLGRVSNVIESTYQQLGGRITVMIKEGDSHHPHSLRDATPIADWIEANWKRRDVKAPSFLGEKVIRTSYYSNRSQYRESDKEGKWITCRGAGFSPYYDRYSFELPGIEGGMTVSVPDSPAPGLPWVYRCGFADRDASVDLALLAKGFHIVNAPVAYNADGPKREDWTKLYRHLTANGFSSKPTMEGAGRAAGEVYAWAIENPQSVSCIYAENPALRAVGSKTSLVDDLGVLAKAGAPLLHVSGTLDPAYEENTKNVAPRYEAMGGKMRMIVKEGQGHTLNPADDPSPAVEFILAAQE